jgi:superfamily II DNA/RNA helicase
MELTERQDTLDTFSFGIHLVLIVADILKLGIGMPLVINCELPASMATYIQRMGCLGLALKPSGIVTMINLVTEHKIVILRELESEQSYHGIGN